MKSLDRKLVTTLFAVFLLAFTGACSSKKVNSTTADTVGGFDDGTRGGSSDTSISKPDDSGWGSKGILENISDSAFYDFAGYQPDELRDLAIYLDLQKKSYNGVDVYEGNLRLSYNYLYTHGDFSNTPGRKETVYKHPVFEAKAYDSSELSKNPSHLKSATQALQFNRFYTKSGKKYWVGFFEEPDFTDFGSRNWDPNGKAGSLMILINDINDRGYSGSVYYKNYDFTYAYKPYYTRCWHIEIGPFSCRDFVVSNVINPPSANFSPSTYRKLGDFYRMDPAAIP